MTGDRRRHLTTPDGHRVEVGPHPDGSRYGDLVRVTPVRADPPRDRVDPLGDYADADGVMHRWRHDTGGDWYHPDPAHRWCRDATCPGNPTGSALALVQVTGYRVDDPGGRAHRTIDLRLLAHPDVDLEDAQLRLIAAVLDLNRALHVEREAQLDRS